MSDAAILARRFAALGHEARLDIVRRLLAAHPHGHVVGELQEALGIPGSTMTHHLDALHHEGLVTKTREGRFLRYRAAGEALRGLLDFLYAECCQHSSAVTPPEGLVSIGLPGGSSRPELEIAPTSQSARGRREDEHEGKADDEASAAEWRAW